MRSRPDRLADDRNPEKPEHDRWDRRDEFDVGFDESFFVRRRNLADVNRRGDAEWHGDEKGHERDHDRANEQRHDPVPILPETCRHPFAAEQE